ncbi:DUF262 domain-containing protein [Phormidium pseudopriestleyi FRX01]|uniref:DUF262 domain-containing protein n=1 Tax=Phormidium pseudopriestleyi FRX01 TaxID=1759528 RepID=A0ABS3FVY2_9CYAN|nr:DUF262 domain-containing protein [Phormidium pseudopriestleyi]MBO0351223.1 DUF262 domain-containing protein [Phormidium pseudopriestleyi FRX01]
MSRTINFQSISWFWDLYTRDLLDLNPPYQRRSVWNQKYKDDFIDTVLNGYPSPAIFLYREITDDGFSKYSVVDGKQRLSTIFEFAENKFPVGEKATITRLRGLSFKELETEVKQSFWTYQFAVESVPSTDEKIINDIFDRINRNVSKLTPQELRHARFDGVFITTVEQLTDWMLSVLPHNFPSIAPKSRKQMKDVEFVTRLLLFLEEGVKSYRPDDLDAAFNDRDLEWENQDKIEDEFKHVINLIQQIFKPSVDSSIDLTKTRLKNQTDFYSFFAAVAELNQKKPLEINREIPKNIAKFLERVESDETRITDKEAQTYYDAIATSLLSGTEKSRTRIDSLKSVILSSIVIVP